ncbi:MAG: NUDIX hydrolase [Candidatus Nanohaloarchaea archaeon]|nr:NUDIX hydrolase [Candidatus Nanohaloarchaea archaeon]
MTDDHHVAEITQQAILFDENGKVLMLKYADDTRRWTFPGGRLHTGETPEEGIRREVREETKLSVSVRLPVYTTAFSYDGEHKFGVAYLCQLEDSRNVKLSDEHQKWEWFDPDEITEDHTVSNDHLEALDAAIKVRKGLQGNEQP